MNREKLLSYLLLAFIIFSCSEEIELQPNESFLKIIDDQDFNASYDPISVGTIANGGLLVVSEIELPDFGFSGSTVLRLDSLGDVVSQEEITEDMVAPVGDLVLINDRHYYASMDRRSLQVHLIAIDQEGIVEDPIPVNGGLRYPLALSKTSNEQLLLLSYDPESRQSVISIINTDGSLVQSAGYTVGAANDIEPIIFNHLTNPFSTLSFFVGESSNGIFYFNGFFNFTLSLVFTTFGDEPTGVLQGQQTFSGVRSLINLSDNVFSLVGFQFEDNFLMPQVSLGVNEIRSTVDFFRGALPELRANAPAKSRIMELSNGNRVIVTVSETENRQAIIYFHDEMGALMGIKLLGSLNPFTFNDVITTEDGGLIVLGTTFLASRFERIYINKISGKEIRELIN